MDERHTQRGLAGGRRRAVTRCAVFFGLTLTLALAACGSRNNAPKVPLPSYVGEQAALFSDLFRPELFGMDGATRPENDTLLAERLRSADTLVPVRVVTINRETRGEIRNYTIVVQPTAEALRGEPVTGPITLNVADRSPAFAWLDGTGEKWVGTRLLLLLRYYEDGPHFYGTVDSAPVREALSRVKLERSPDRAD